jgi:hypothetical protein
MSDREWQEVRDKRKEFRKDRKGKFPGGISPIGANFDNKKSKPSSKNSYLRIVSRLFFTATRCVMQVSLQTFGVL